MNSSRIYFEILIVVINASLCMQFRLYIFFLMTNNWHKDTRDRLSFIGGANGENMN